MGKEIIQRPEKTTTDAIVQIGSEDAIESLLSLVGAKEPILDPTFGNGVFWKNSKRNVHGYDINPLRGPHGVIDFNRMPFDDNSFETVVFDPPFHPFVNSSEEERFSGMGKNEKELRLMFESGVRECWRVTKRHLIVKCQSYIHNHRPQWMPLWAINICGEPFEWLIANRSGKRISGRWKTVRSLRRRHADYLLFDKFGNHR